MINYQVSTKIRLKISTCHKTHNSPNQIHNYKYQVSTIIWLKSQPVKLNMCLLNTLTHINKSKPFTAFQIKHTIIKYQASIITREF